MLGHQAPISSAPQRLTRAAVSYTIRDMQAERDKPVERILPKQRTLCETRGIT